MKLKNKKIKKIIKKNQQTKKQRNTTIKRMKTKYDR